MSTPVMPERAHVGKINTAIVLRDQAVHECFKSPDISKIRRLLSAHKSPSFPHLNWQGSVGRHIITRGLRSAPRVVCLPEIWAGDVTERTLRRFTSTSYNKYGDQAGKETYRS